MIPSNYGAVVRIMNGFHLLIVDVRAKTPVGKYQKSNQNVLAM